MAYKEKLQVLAVRPRRRYWLHEQQELFGDKEADAPTTFLNETVIISDLLRLFHSFIHSFILRGQMFSELCPESKHDIQKYRTGYFSLA